MIYREPVLTCRLLLKRWKMWKMSCGETWRMVWGTTVSPLKVSSRLFSLTSSPKSLWNTSQIMLCVSLCVSCLRIWLGCVFSSCQGSCSYTHCSFREGGTKPRGLCSEGLATMTTWNSPRNICFHCEYHIQLWACSQVKARSPAESIMQFNKHLITQSCYVTFVPRVHTLLAVSWLTSLCPFSCSDQIMCLHGKYLSMKQIITGLRRPSLYKCDHLF